MAQTIITEVDSYAEVSPTRTGVKILLRGELPSKHKTKNKTGTVEIYTRGRFFCVTGHRIAGEQVEDRQEQLKAAWKTHIGSQKSRVSVASHVGVDAACLDDMLNATRNMEDKNDGSKRLIVAIFRSKEHNLAPDDALATVRECLRQRPTPEDWSDDQILDRIGQAESRDDVVRGAAVTITNYRTVEVTGDDGDKKVQVPLSMSEIIENIRRHADDWPRRVDNMLFVKGEHGIDYFDRRTTAGLFGWLRRLFRVDWKAGGNFVSASELFAEIERTAPRYDAIEVLPHERPIEGIYYRYPAPPAGDGKHLRWLLNRFRPETTADRELIQAAMMTAFWGGPPGTRPAFVITSDDGRGVGKSILAQIIGHLCGGMIDASANEDIGTLKTRLLTPSARTTRIATLDNVKSLRMTWAELEAMITAPTISGKQNYVGEGQRPNLLTWFITLNGVNLSTDLAQRSVIIKLVRGENSGAWLEDTLQYINQHRQAIIGDIVAALRAEQKHLASHTRWGTWEKYVLSRLPNPGDAQRLILERQSESNAELEEAEMIEEYFSEQLELLGHDPKMAQLRIPSQTAAEWFCRAIGQQMKSQSASKRLSQMAKEGQLKSIAPDASRTYGRCFIWTGVAADVLNDHIKNHLVIHHKKCDLALACQDGAAG